eukprot:g75449.t1
MDGPSIGNRRSQNPSYEQQLAHSRRRVHHRFVVSMLALFSSLVGTSFALTPDEKLALEAMVDLTWLPSAECPTIPTDETIICDKDGHVKELNLFLWHEPASSIPKEISGLVYLETLVAAGNSKLTGTVPYELGNLRSLVKLDLSDNVQLSGTLPASLGNLTQLDYLDTSGTSITGGDRCPSDDCAWISTCQVSRENDKLWYLCSDRGFQRYCGAVWKTCGSDADCPSHHRCVDCAKASTSTVHEPETLFMCYPDTQPSGYTDTYPNHPQRSTTSEDEVDVDDDVEMLPPSLTTLLTDSSTSTSFSPSSSPVSSSRTPSSSPFSSSPSANASLSPPPSSDTPSSSPLPPATQGRSPLEVSLLTLIISGSAVGMCIGGCVYYRVVHRDSEVLVPMDSYESGLTLHSGASSSSGVSLSSYDEANEGFLYRPPELRGGRLYADY